MPFRDSTSTASAAFLSHLDLLEGGLKKEENKSLQRLRQSMYQRLSWEVAEYQGGRSVLKTIPLKVVVVAVLVILMLLTVSLEITARDEMKTISAEEATVVKNPTKADGETTSNKADKTLDDARYSWARDDIEALAKMGAIIGYPDGTFKPNQAITRAEFATMLCKALGLEKADDASEMPYTDLDGHWAEKYVDILHSHELLGAMDGDDFEPDAQVTRSEIVSTLMDVLQVKDRFGALLEKVDSSFIDLTSDDSLFVYVEAAEKLGIIPIHFGVAFEPNRPVTRAEAAAMVNRLIGLDVIQGMVTSVDSYGNMTVVGENAQERQISVTTDTMTVRNGLAARPNTVKTGDIVYVIARDDNAEFVYSFGELTQEDIATRLSGVLKGLLTQEEVAALVRGDYDTVREQVAPKLKQRLMDEGLSEAEAEALASRSWDQIPSLLQERAISLVSQRLNVPPEVVMDAVQQKWDSLRSYAEQKLTEFAITALMQSGVIDNSTGAGSETANG